ncbi:uncharacterized protein [Drosophila kikkawai]|uniref:Salivary secreted peptide n=1 Tax=Drosophila kikkawai TaxID=30033 RepID=A0A6P4IXA2_DROKI|nr:uncharacterized protein LOC108077937 [Drosophila kikkawai]
MRLLTVLLSVLVAIHGYSMQFGRMHRASVPIYDAEFKLNHSADYIDVQFKQKSTALSFNINMILVLDESDWDRRGRAIILSGGVGVNFTTLRLMYSRPKGGKITVLIYGLPRNRPILDLNTK